jgi:hypothetical protein
MEYCNHLGYYYETQGRYSDALVLYEEVICYFNGAMEKNQGDISPLPRRIARLERWINKIHQRLDEADSNRDHEVIDLE